MVFRGYRDERRVTRPMAWVLALLALQVVLGGVTVLLRTCLDGGRPLRRGGAAGGVDHARRRTARLPGLRAGTARLLLAARSDGSSRSASACSWRARPWPTRTPTPSAAMGSRSCNGSLVPTLNHHVIINLIHRVWAGAMLVLALWVLFRSRRDRAGCARDRADGGAVVAVLYFVQAGSRLGSSSALAENTAVEVVHSSFASLTWLALATLRSLTWTLAARQPTVRRDLGSRCSHERVDSGLDRAGRGRGLLDRTAGARALPGHDTGQLGSEARWSPVTAYARARLPPQTSRNSQRPHLPFSASGSRSSRKSGESRYIATGSSLAHVAGGQGQEAGGHHLAQVRDEHEAAPIVDALRRARTIETVGEAESRAGTTRGSLAHDPPVSAAPRSP